MADRPAFLAVDEEHGRQVRADRDRRLLPRLAAVRRDDDVAALADGDEPVAGARDRLHQAAARERRDLRRRVEHVGEAGARHGPGERDRDSGDEQRRDGMACVHDLGCLGSDLPARRDVRARTGGFRWMAEPAQRSPAPARASDDQKLSLRQLGHVLEAVVRTEQPGDVVRAGVEVVDRERVAERRLHVVAVRLEREARPIELAARVVLVGRRPPSSCPRRDRTSACCRCGACPA